MKPPSQLTMILVLRMDYMEVGETWFHTVQDDQQPSVWGRFIRFPSCFRYEQDLFEIHMN